MWARVMPGVRLLLELSNFRGNNMKSFRAFVSLFVLLVGAPYANAQGTKPTETNGTIVEQTPCSFPAYEAQPNSFKQFYPKEEYERAKNHPELECARMKYLSDGFKVVGFLVRPKKVEAKKYPVIIFNRGGFLDFGKIDLYYILDFYRLASEGFVVVATQYRGNDGGEGKEEIGGADVNDVLNLLPLIRSLDYADPHNIFMYGASRGAMMAFLAVKRGMPVNALAVMGALYDVEAITKRNPLLLEVAKQRMPDYAVQGVAALRERSVLNWVEQINVPVLILHGGADRSVPPTEPLTFAQRLQGLGRKYELIIYAEDMHETFMNREDRNKRVTHWFKKRLK
jgi:dipeptidyl aminopeptidase/acylaminoacyl peptidase